MRIIRAFVAVLAFATASAVNATSWSTDQSDLWWNPTESGWGMQVVQTWDTAFVTIYVYRTDRSPVWYSGTIKGSIASMTGDLYETSGPWFGGPFTGFVGLRKVGTITWNSLSVADARVTYSVDGVVVIKNVERQPLVNEDNSGYFRGAANVNRSSGNCSAYILGKGQSGDLEIVQPSRGRAMRVTLRVGGDACVMANGDYLQFGRFGDVYGSFLCGSGDRGTLSLLEMRPGFDTFTSRFEYTSSITGCVLEGDFAGVRM
jgi:hypothetical protein